MECALVAFCSLVFANVWGTNYKEKGKFTAEEMTMKILAMNGK